MDTRPDHIDDLIAIYLAGEATPDQISLVELWKNKNKSNLKYFEQLKLIFQNAGNVEGTPQFDTDSAWRKLRSRINPKRDGKTIPLRREDSAYKFLLRIAAGITIILMVGFFTYQFFKPDSSESIQVIAGRKTESDTLPDGSGVFLNRQTKIEYAVNKKKNMRVAKLVGEAYFNIKHDDNKTFIVEASGVLVKDIGTSFNVKAYPDSDTVEVIVEEGEVMFYTEDNPGVYLRANGKGVYHKKTKTFTVAVPEPNATAYRTKFFSFSNHSLATVIQTLNDVYASKIQIDDKLKNCRITVSFNDESIDEIANIIGETLGLTVNKTGNVIRLEGPGCLEDTP